MTYFTCFSCTILSLRDRITQTASPPGTDSASPTVLHKCGICCKSPVAFTPTSEGLDNAGAIHSDFLITNDTDRIATIADLYPSKERDILTGASIAEPLPSKSESVDSKTQSAAEADPLTGIKLDSVKAITADIGEPATDKSDPTNSATSGNTTKQDNSLDAIKGELTDVSLVVNNGENSQTLTVSNGDIKQVDAIANTLSTSEIPSTITTAPKETVNTSEIPSTVTTAAKETVSTSEIPSTITTAPKETVSTSEIPSTITTAPKETVSTAEIPSTVTTAAKETVSTSELPSTITTAPKETVSTSELPSTITTAPKETVSTSDESSHAPTIASEESESIATDSSLALSTSIDWSTTTTSATVDDSESNSIATSTTPSSSDSSETIEAIADNSYTSSTAADTATVPDAVADDQNFITPQINLGASLSSLQIIDFPDFKEELNPTPTHQNSATQAVDITSYNSTDVTSTLPTINPQVEPNKTVLPPTQLAPETIKTQDITTVQNQVTSSLTVAQENNFQIANQPLIGIIDTGFAANNPDIDYSRVTLGRDRISDDENPLLSTEESDRHGTTILSIIAAKPDSATNPQAPIWLGRATGSGHWADSLVEFVNAAKTSKQPNAVVNLSFDLTQLNQNGTITTRYSLTPEERAAIALAQKHHILIVAAAENESGTISALGQASQEFDNIITVGAAQDFDRAAYSSYGEGLDILAGGSAPSDRLQGNTEQTVGTSFAAAKVTKAVSEVWAANPELSYLQIKDILKSTATDLNTPGWDAQTGVGLLNLEKAVATASKTLPNVASKIVFKEEKNFNNKSENLQQASTNEQRQYSSPNNISPSKVTQESPKPLLSDAPPSESIKTESSPQPTERPAGSSTSSTYSSTSSSTGDYYDGSSHINSASSNNSTSDSSANGTTSTSSQNSKSSSESNSSWDKSSVKSNGSSNSSSLSTSGSNTSASTYTSSNKSENTSENNSKWENNYSRVKSEGDSKREDSSATKSRSSNNYTTQSYTSNSNSEAYRTSQSNSANSYSGNSSNSVGNRSDNWGSQSAWNNSSNSTNYTSSSSGESYLEGKANWQNSSNNNNSTANHNGEETSVNKSRSQTNSESGPYKNSSNSSNYAIAKSKWKNSNIGGIATSNSNRDNYSESNSNSKSTYDDGPSKSNSSSDSYSLSQSAQNSGNIGNSYWNNNHGNNYSITQSSGNSSYNNGPSTSRSSRNGVSVNKSNSSSSTSGGKTTSKNNASNYSENQSQANSEYKGTSYTTKSKSDESTVTVGNSSSSYTGSESTSNSHSETSRNTNSESVTEYTNGSKTENGSKSYEKWFNESTTDSKNGSKSVSRYERWNSSYSKSYFKGGYSWTETVSGYKSESGSNAGKYSSQSSSWSWTRSGYQYDDGRTGWSESSSKSSWNNGKNTNESDSKSGSFDPNRKGPQVNKLPKLGDAPELKKVPKLDVPPQLVKPPKPGKNIWQLPTFIVKNPYPKTVSSGDQYSSGGNQYSNVNNPKNQNIWQKFFKKLLEKIQQGRQALLDFLKSLLYHYLKNNGALLLPLTDLLTPGGAEARAKLERLWQNNKAAQAGRGIADLVGILQGIAEILFGGGGIAGGGLTANPALVAGSSLAVAHGLSVVGVSAQDLANLIGQVLQINSGDNFWNEVSQDDWEDFVEPAYSPADFPDTRSWQPGTYGTPEGSLQQHFTVHGAEVGANNMEEYIQKAEEFKQVVLSNTRIQPRPISGGTANVFRYESGDRYIDLVNLGQGEYGIISFGRLWHR